MKRLLIPILLMLVGIGSGVGAGLALRKPVVETPEIAALPCGEIDGQDHEVAQDYTKGKAADYAKLNNQFIVPVVREGRVSSLVVLALSIEVSQGGKEAVYLAEPKLRDSFLQAMFDHANIGGFDGNFTSGESLRPLRIDLVMRAKRILPDIVSDVLIIDITRQDS